MLGNNKFNLVNTENIFNNIEEIVLHAGVASTAAAERAWGHVSHHFAGTATKRPEGRTYR